MTTENKVKNILIAFAVSIILVTISTGLLHFINPDIDEVLIKMKYTNAQLLYRFFGLCILAPIVEELIFRWFPITLIRATPIYNLLELPVVIGGSIIFGWMHGDETNVLIQGLVGVCLYWVYIRNKFDITSSMLVHSMYNFFLFIHVLNFPTT